MTDPNDADSDDDGFDDAVEIAHIHSEGKAGNPLTSSGPDSDFCITAVAHDAAANTVTITWDSVPGTEYVLQSSTDLHAWQDIDDKTATGASTSIVDDFINVGEARVYYRISVAD